MIPIFAIKKKKQKKRSKLIYLSVTLIDSVLRTVENHYPQVLLEEYKYIVSEKMSYYITDDIEFSSDNSDREDSGKNNSSKENFDEEKFDKEN